ncbi:DUF397 domain-containing protein [Nocardia sp. NPDC004604]|uniref:DUF397 domain-containing protein n=1 Tax=Nocardia sp. NPDC004604 TaxID=3157013 RepID=UPI0033BCC034
MTVDISGVLWFKSSYGASNGQGVEVISRNGDVVGVRDSVNEERHVREARINLAHKG